MTDDETHEDFADDDTLAHADIRAALADEPIVDGRMEDAIVLLYDMGIREAYEITDDDLDELRDRGLLDD